ncbi:MAG: hypothetical protein ACJA2W_003977, partial [Planctomycetota bacterium]
MGKIILLAFGACTASLTLASDIHVGSGSSIQAAIDVAVGGDRVLIAAGTYVERLDLRGKAIELICTDGPTATIIDANYAGVALRMISGEGAGTVLRSLTTTGGSGGFGPGGVVTNGTPLLEDCIIRNNVGRLGGGVHGDATLVRCRIENNTSSLSHGGGIAVHSSAAVTIDRCVIADNLASGSLGGAQAGGVWATSATTITRLVAGGAKGSTVSWNRGARAGTGRCSSRSTVP